MPLAVFVDFLLQIFIFLTGNQADLRERGEVLVGLRQVVLEEIGDADVFVGAEMARVEAQRPVVLGERALEIACMAV